MSKRIIAIDPGHGGYGIAWFKSHMSIRHDPENYNYLTGTDKPGIGCPELCSSLYNALGHLRGRIIIIEEPRGRRNAAASLNRDIGYIQKYFEDMTIVICQPTDWKMHLQKLGFLPTGSGRWQPVKYKPHLDTHFGIEMVADCWAAWGMCVWGSDNIE